VQLTFDSTHPLALSLSGAGDALPLPDSVDGTVLLQLPQRPFGASAELPASLVRSLAGERARAPPPRRLCRRRPMHVHAMMLVALAALLDCRPTLMTRPHA
jgi:hypothetical protein